MKKILKRMLILVLALSMVFGLSVSAFADDEMVNPSAEGTVAEEAEASAEIVTEEIAAAEGLPDKYVGLSFKQMAVLEDLDGGMDYVEGELLVIYSDVDSADFAVATMCSQGEDAVSVCGDDTVKVTFDVNEISMEDKIIELSKEDNVKYVQPNYIYKLIKGSESYQAYEAIEGMAEVMTTRMDDLLNDQAASNQMYFSQVHMGEAWAIVKKHATSKVKVAVIDTGARTSHKDLTNLNKNLCVCVEGDAKPYPKQTIDDNGHGSHVTGIIGATANNGILIAGGATLGMSDPSSMLELFSIDAYTKAEDGFDSADLKKALVFAADNGAKVISMSLGGIETAAQWKDDVTKEGIDYAYSKGAVCVCAAGNKNYNSDYISTYPSDYEKVISVIALNTIVTTDTFIAEFWNENVGRAWFSNYGHAQDISAPGMNILSCYNNSDSDWEYLDGTSQATPIVSSIIALMFMMKPNLTFNEVYSIITSTATDMVYEQRYNEYYYPVYEHAGVGFDIYTAYGMINAEACVLALAPEVFTDVHKADWFYSSVSDMYYRGIMTGMGGTNNFGPGEKLQREQLAKILYFMEGQPAVDYEAKFPDVPQDAWFANPVIWAYKNNIITGYTSGYFGAGDPITREQFAIMLYRYAKYKFPNSYGHYGSPEISGYADFNQVSDWAVDAMKWAVGAGIITGKQGGLYLDPGGNAQRCEAATMIQRFQYKFMF